MQKMQFEITLPNGTVIDIMLGDLTKMKSDAVVSSSGADLSHKGGVSKAIAIACGRQFQAEGKEFIRTDGLLKEGSTFVQPADGELAKNGVRYVIHAIAPLPKKGADVQQLLVKTIREALKEAEELKCRTIAFPAICAGVMGVPIATCGLCYWVAMAKFSSKNPDPHLKKISFVVDNSGFMLELYNILADMSAKGKAGASNQHQQ
ncbi:macro domain-containing protein DR_2288-like [Watersipora subatra]|uniref:macro domain-containing protein DR_2288-like n=1 Tax=Watersipora subatra TaxID=2589382 RepID=UPI00355C0E7B